MVWNVQAAAGDSYTVPAHLVDKIFSNHYNLLTAVLNSDQ